MAKVQFQVDGLDSNTASIFNDDVTFDGNVDAASISIGGTDISDIYATESYVASALSSVTVDLSAAAGDGLEWDAIAETFDVVGMPSFLVSSNTSLDSNAKYFVDSSIARTITLPTSPLLGDEIQVFDSSGLAGTNNITVNSNSLKINGTVQDLLIDENAVSVSLVYTGSTYGWKVS